MTQKHIDEIEFTVFDTETTGLDPAGGDRVIEIACLRFKGKSLVDKFETLINPAREISPAAYAVNKISSEMLRHAPEFGAIAARLLTFIEGSCLCSYNASFDMGFLNNELRLLGQDALDNTPVVDVLKMARRILPGLERYALWFIAAKLGIKDLQEHRALSDVQMTWQIFSRFKEMLYDKGIHDYNSFLHLFGITSKVWEDINNQKISQIQEAMDLKSPLLIRYFAASDAQVTERTVIPKEIRKENDQSYLVGFCSLRRDERNFRIDSIIHLEMAKDVSC